MFQAVITQQRKKKGIKGRFRHSREGPDHKRTKVSAPAGDLRPADGFFQERGTYRQRLRPCQGCAPYKKKYYCTAKNTVFFKTAGIGCHQHAVHYSQSCWPLKMAGKYQINL